LLDIINNDFMDVIVMLVAGLVRHLVIPIAGQISNLKKKSVK